MRYSETKWAEYKLKFSCKQLKDSHACVCHPVMIIFSIRRNTFIIRKNLNLKTLSLALIFSYNKISIAFEGSYIPRSVF